MAKMAYDPTISHGEVVDEPRNNNNPQNHTQPIFTQGLDYNIQTPYVNPQNNTTPQNGTPDVISGADAPLPGSNSSTAPSTTPSTTPNNGGTPSGGGGYYPTGGGGTPSYTAASVQAGNNTAPIQAGELGDNTNFLLQEYNNMDAYQQRQEELTENTTKQLIDLANAQIDETVAMQIAGLTNQLDKAKRQYSQARAKLTQMKATEADNLALSRQAKGDYGGVAQAQYSAQMQQRDQALYEIDLEQINLEQDLEQAILEAQATGNYQKLARQIEFTQAMYEQLYALASQVMQVKTQDAGQLDNYYEGIREFNANYNLQVQQIQQNAVINKIQYGIRVTPEDMMQFGLRGADAQGAADEINTASGIQRQMYVEELRSMQAKNNGYSGGSAYYSSGSGGGGGESTASTPTSSTGLVHDTGGGRSFASPELNESQVIAALNNGGISGSNLIELRSNLDSELSKAQLQLANLEAHRGQLAYDDYYIYRTQLADKIEYLQNLRNTYFG